jgi:hypothetical protein
VDGGLREAFVRRALVAVGATLIVLLMAACALTSQDEPDVATVRPLANRVAEAERVILGFIEAFNAGDYQRALNSFATDPDIGVSDCDYRLEKSVRFIGRPEVERWLRDRSAEHDRLTLDRMRMIFDHGLLVGAVIQYRRRTSDTLSELGLRGGIRPGVATKVAFTEEGPIRITQFANAGNDDVCRIAIGRQG